MKPFNLNVRDCLHMAGGALACHWLGLGSALGACLLSLCLWWAIKAGK